MKFSKLSLEDIQNSTHPIAVLLDEDTTPWLSKILGDTFRRYEANAEKPNTWTRLAYPSGLGTPSLWLCAKTDDPMKSGAKLAQALFENDLENITVFGADPHFAYGFALRNYRFEKYKSTPKPTLAPVFATADPAMFERDYAPFASLVQGTHLVRDLVNEPANTLNTESFATHIKSLESEGIEVEILDEAKLKDLGFRALLAVGQGSRNPSKVAIMRWKGKNEAPVLLVGKGVVFDSGGISIKPAEHMEEMIMDMGGAATVVGTMLALAKRQTKAHVVGIVGLVENMPDGNAQRPGDIVKSLKGDTIDVINTDAEGRLVLADCLWYGQTRFEPRAVIDFATLTGAIIVALAHENAGIFTNNDKFRDKLLVAARAEGEGAWPMPMGEGYAKLIKSTHADIKNVGGRWGGAITAAEFLKCFVKPDIPWMHVDIAGVAFRDTKTDDFAPKGASGWGVRTIVRLIEDEAQAAG